MSSLSKDLSNRLSKSHYGSKNTQELRLDFEKFLDAYDRESIGPNRLKNLTDFLKSFNGLIIQRLAETVNSETTREANQKMRQKTSQEEKQRELREKLKNLDDRLSRARNDEQDYEKDLSKLNKENDEMRQILEDASNNAKKEK